MSNMRKISQYLLFAALVGCGASAPQVRPESQIKIGEGSFSKELVPGEKPPSNEQGQPVTPRVTADFKQVPTTNEWWSSLIWQFRKEGNAFSEEMHPHPLTLKARADGLELGYPTVPMVNEREYQFAHKADLVVGVSGLNASEEKVASYSDWAVTADISDAAHALRATIGHGLPFVYVSGVKGTAAVTPVDADLYAAVKSRQGNVVVLELHDHRYALFAPPGSTWELAQDTVTADLRGADYFSVAVLPDAKPETLALFTKYAFSFVTGTAVSYRFDPAQSKLVATFAFTTEDKTKGKAPVDGALFALYRHQWLNATAQFTGSTYVSARGEMRLAQGKSFEVGYNLGTLLPTLPAVGDYSRGRMVGMLKQAARGNLFPIGLEGTRDSYWEGKSFGRNSDLVYIADQIGKTGLRDKLLDAIKAELEDWFDGQNPRYFYYDANWHTLIGIPSQYFSGSMMNDHHFHYGYFIYAAATVAQFDPEWAKKWAPMVDLLIQDAGNWQHEDRFPFMRNFDVYAGHSWASGTTLGNRGNNEESSSEDVNFAASVALWGEVMDKPEIRDAGLFQYTSLVNSIEQYWYDVDNAVYPEAFPRPSVGIVWGDGAVYDTWFSYLPAFIHGIQITPFSVGALWFGRRPDNVERTLAYVEKGNDGPLHLWREMFWMVEALKDPAHAAARFEDEHWFEPEGGSSLAHTYRVLTALNGLGTLDTKVTADVPFYAVFEQKGKKSYVAFNGGAQPRLVHFSDGATLQVPARSMANK